MKAALYIIRRTWMIILLVCISVLFITTHTRLQLGDDSWNIIIGPDNTVTTDVTVGNQTGSKELMPSGTISNYNTQTDRYELRFIVQWTSDSEISANLVGNLQIIVGTISVYDGDTLIANSETDPRLNNWVRYEISGYNHEVTINNNTYITVAIMLNDPGTITERAQMANMLAGRRLVLSFSFEVEINQMGQI